MDVLELDPELKFYLVGLIASDGCLWKDKPTIEISLHERDKSLLDELCSKLNPFAHIYHQPSYRRVKLYIFCKSLYGWLISIGITPRKSETLNINHDAVPDHMFPHFLRGYIDGDGSIQKIKNRHARITITGNMETMKWLHDSILKNFNIPSGLFKINSSSHYQMYKVAVQRWDDVCRLLNILYCNASVFLDRKFKTASLIMCRPVE